MFVHVPILMLRICDEEAMLKEELEGYTDYRRQVRYRLFPGVIAIERPTAGRGSASIVLDVEAHVVRLTPFRFSEPRQEKRQKPCAVPLPICLQTTGQTASLHP
jgi:hypothetical protein